MNATQEAAAIRLRPRAAIRPILGILACIGAVHRGLAAGSAFIPGWRYVEAALRLLASPIYRLSRLALRFDVVRRWEWILETEILQEMHPLVVLVSGGLAVWRGLLPTQYGHIGTDPLIYPLLGSLSCFNPFLGVVCALAFGAGDIVQKLFWPDIYLTTGSAATPWHDADYWLAMLGYCLAYSAALTAGLLPGFCSRVCRAAVRRVLLAIFYTSAAETADGAVRGDSRHLARTPLQGDFALAELAASAVGAGVGGFAAVHAARVLELPAFFMRFHPDYSCYNLEANRWLIARAEPVGRTIGTGGPILAELLAPRERPGSSGGSGSGDVIDPWTGRPLTRWEPGRFRPGENGKEGKPGQVWFGHDWVDAEYARQFIAESLAAERQRAVDGDRLAAQFDEEALRELRNRHDALEDEAARERVERSRKEQAWQTLMQIEQASTRQKMDDIWDRAAFKAVSPDGQIDVEYVEKLKAALRDRIDLGQKAPDESLHGNWVLEGIADTAKNPWAQAAVRLGVGLLTGGSSEVLFQSVDAGNAMIASFDQAAANGKSWGCADAVKAGFGQLVRENLPINTVERLTDSNATWGDVALGGVIDCFATRTLQNLKGSIEAARAGKDIMEVLTYDAYAVGAGEPREPVIPGSRTLDAPYAGGGTPRQQLEMGCAPATMQGMLQDAGRQLTQDEIIAVSGLPRDLPDGMSKSAVLKTMEDLGMNPEWRSNGWKLRANPSPTGDLPGLLPAMRTELAEGNQVAAVVRRLDSVKPHMVRVEGITSMHVYYGDPATGCSHQVSGANFNAQMSGAFVCKPS